MPSSATGKSIGSWSPYGPFSRTLIHGAPALGVDSSPEECSVEGAGQLPPVVEGLGSETLWDSATAPPPEGDSLQGWGPDLVIAGCPIVSAHGSLLQSGEHPRSLSSSGELCL